MGPMRKGDTIRCLSNGRKGRECLPYDSKEFKAASGNIPTQFRSQRYKASVETNKMR
jgi:hypothetical protein